MPLFDWGCLDALTRIRRQYLAAGVRAELEEHALSINFGAMAPGVFVERPLVIPKEADFVWMATAIQPHGNNQGVLLPGFFLSVAIHPPGRVLSNHHDVAGGAGGFTPVNSMAGRGRMPFTWPVPLVLGASILVTFEMRNRGTATATPVLSLLGVRARRYEAAA